MRPYAVISGNSNDHPVMGEVDYPWVLGAFGAPHFDELGYKPPGGIILDSGAFHAWSKGKQVDRARLLSWAVDIQERYGANESRLVNLDVIPGEKGRQASYSEKVKAAERGAENAVEIRRLGFSVIEVFHGGEPFAFLDDILDRRQPHELIAVGGMGALSRPQKHQFCAQVFTVLNDRYGNCIPPVHGLGMAADTPLVRRFPWFSCDASSWFTARNFNLHVGKGGNFYERDREIAPVTTQAMRFVFAVRRLQRWVRYGESLTRMWEQRGITFDLADLPDRVVA